MNKGEEVFWAQHERACQTVAHKLPSSEHLDSLDHLNVLPQISPGPSKPFQRHKESRIVEFHNYSPQHRIINFNPSSPCQSYTNILVSIQYDQCLALGTSSSITNSNLLQRFNSKPAGSKKEIAKMWKNPAGGPYRSSGFFTKGGNEKGRRRFSEKIGPLIENLYMVEGEILEKLAARGLPVGSDVTVLVTNDGQMDLFMNFACSCHFHSISMENTVVFAASREIVPLISSTGAIGIFHEQFASASRKSSGAYLDSVFVDMMWYKAFSVWLILKLGYNVLFQDVDIIWFKDPFPYFHDSIRKFREAHPTKSPPEAFLSDDGQRTTVRYAPFYANSGFYYLVSNPKTVNLAWNIMSSFDVMQSSGSHQNVFTMKLMEAMDFGKLHSQSLHLHNFSNGATFHHEKKYFLKIKNKEVVPYMFHMCWTANKGDKLKFLKESLMWYVSPKYEVSSLIPGGKFSTFLKSKRVKQSSPPDKKWSIIADEVCHAMPGAP